MPGAGVPDGFKVDSMGNVYTGGSGGLYILDSKGKKLGRIVHGHPATTNVAFGGDDWKTLFITTARRRLSADELARQPLAGCLLAIRTDVPGLPEPRPYAGIFLRETTPPLHSTAANAPTPREQRARRAARICPPRSW